MLMSRGFTLVEILVSVGIVVLMLGVGIPAFQEFGKRAEVDQAASEVQDAIFEARNLALAPESDKSSDVFYYGMMFHNASNSSVVNQYSVVRIFVDPSSGLPIAPTIPLNDDVLVKTRTLPNGLAFLTVPQQLWYSIPDQGEISFGGDSPAIYRVGSDPVVGKSLTINGITGQVVVDDL